MSFFGKLKYWSTHGLKDVGKSSSQADEKERRVYDEGGGWTVLPDPIATGQAYGLAHAGPIAGPKAPYVRSPAMTFQPGVNPFLAAANRAGMNVNPQAVQANPLAQQTATAAALRGANNGG